MIRSVLLGAAALTALTIFACSSSDTPADNGGGVSACTNPIVSNTDGTSACEPRCSAGQHCSTSGVTCIDGCTTAANCAQGEACDKSAATKDIEGNADGICRAPTPCATPSTSSSSSSSGSTSGTSGTSSSVVGCFTSTGAAPTGACQTYQSCVPSKCDTQLKAAFGDSYASGKVGGTCSAFYSCISAQGCSSESEQSCASQATDACKTSLQAVSSCVQSSCGSDQTACANSLTGGSTSGGTPDAGPSVCTKLITCCQAITDTQTRQECSQQASSNQDFACQSALNQYEANNDCPTQ